jgi:hypothetical protein
VLVEQPQLQLMELLAQSKTLTQIQMLQVRLREATT